MSRERYGKRHDRVYSGTMPNMILAPIESEPTTTCLKVDKVEWLIFLALMRDEGRSASDRIRELVRDVVKAHQAKERSGAE